jgi:23S rRNA (adenine2503-C2)-methyltransferase
MTPRRRQRVFPTEATTVPEQRPSKPTRKPRSSKPARKPRSSKPARKPRSSRPARKQGPSKPDLRRNKRSSKPDLRGISLDELKSFVLKLDQPAYRAGQIADWVFKRGVRSFDEMTNLSKDLRELLSRKSFLSCAKVVETHTSQVDGTQKLLLAYGRTRIEAVLLKDDERITGCVSTQVGCKFACSFCATGAMGFKRNLTAGEIVEQMIALREAAAPDRLGNVVFMGMGEPFDNYDNVMRAIRIANAEWGLGIGARRMTVSTAGHVPGIRKLAGEGLQIHLAVSLNAPVQGLRATLMPIADRYSLTQLLGAIEQYSERTGRRATLEYVLLKDFNDSPEMAAALAEIARRLLCKVNIICYNETADSVFEPPTDQIVESFLAEVRKRCSTVVRRVSRGSDIAAGCGQLCVPRDGT